MMFIKNKDFTTHTGLCVVEISPQNQRGSCWCFNPSNHDGRLDWETRRQCHLDITIMMTIIVIVTTMWIITIVIYRYIYIIYTYSMCTRITKMLTHIEILKIQHLHTEGQTSSLRLRPPQSCCSMNSRSTIGWCLENHPSKRCESRGSKHQNILINGCSSLQKYCQK